MKKVIVATLVAATLFGSAKVSQPKKEEFWVADTKYSCMLDKSNIEVTLIGSSLLKFGNGIFTHINSEYDVYSRTDADGTLYIGLTKGNQLNIFGNNGSLYIDCKKK